MSFNGWPKSGFNNGEKKPERNKRYGIYRIKDGKRVMKVGDVNALTFEAALWEAERFFNPLGWQIEIDGFSSSGRGRPLGSGKSKVLYRATQVKNGAVTKDAGIGDDDSEMAVHPAMLDIMDS